MQNDNLDMKFRPELVGRGSELTKLTDSLDAVVEGNGSTTFISGEAGIGKTRLVEELISAAEERGAKMIRGWCLAESLEPLMPFKEALRDADLYHLIAESPPPKVISAYLIDDAGMLISKAEREETDLDPDIFASMLTAVENFISDSLSMMGEMEASKLNTIGYGEHDILIQTVGDLSMATVIEGTNSEFLIDDMKKTLADIGTAFDDWSGDMKKAEEIQPKIDWFINSRKYRGRYLVDDPKIKQENLFDNVLKGLRRIASEQPIVLFLDDLQWADPTTLNLLHYLSRNTRDYEVFILGTYRPEDISEIPGISKGRRKSGTFPADVSELSSTIPNVGGICQKIPADIVEGYYGKTHQLKIAMQNMSREGLFKEIKLNRLDGSMVEEFATKTLGQVDMKEEFADRIYYESEGNPFFLLELIQMLVEEEHLKEEDGVWSLERSIDEVNIPSKIYDVIVRRLGRLIKEQSELLECASVIGEEFDSQILEGVTGRNRIDILKNLNEIEKVHNLIHSMKKKYRFDHNKIREVLYNDINEELRVEYHRVVAESYEELYKDNLEDAVENIAYHYFKAEDERAVEYLLDAGDKSKDKYANIEAERFYRNALSLIDEGDKRSVRAYEGMGDVIGIIGEYDEALKNYKNALDLEDDNKKKARLYGKIAGVYVDKGEYDRSLEYADKGMSLTTEDDVGMCRLLNKKGWAYTRQGDYDTAMDIFEEERVLSDRLDEKKDYAQALHDIGTIYISKGDYDEGKDYLEKALAIRTKIEDVKGMAKSLNNIGSIHYRKSEFDESLEFHERSLETAEEIGNKDGIGISLNNIGTIYSAKGEKDKALQYYKRSLETAEEISDKNSIALSLNNIGIIYNYKGELYKALEYFQRSLEMREEIGDKNGIAMSLGSIGTIYSDKGELDKALEYYKRSLEMREEIGYKGGIAYSLCNIGMIYSDKGELDKAKNNAEKALKISKEIGAKSREGESHKILGMVYRGQERWKEAKEEFEKGIEILEMAGEKKELAEALYEYGLMWKAKGDREHAEENLTKSLSMFEEMTMKLLIDKAKEALSSL